jgi:hypothetical protein
MIAEHGNRVELIQPDAATLPNPPDFSCHSGRFPAGCSACVFFTDFSTDFGADFRSANDGLGGTVG